MLGDSAIRGVILYFDADRIHKNRSQIHSSFYIRDNKNTEEICTRGENLMIVSLAAVKYRRYEIMNTS